MEQIGIEASSQRSMENRCLVNLFEFIGKKHLQPDKKKKKNSVSVSKLNQNIKKRRTLFVASPK